jgi:hypothetical protein
VRHSLAPDAPVQGVPLASQHDLVAIQGCMRAPGRYQLELGHHEL